ncbi:ImmA/IrrE family metallo-endopeptidase (plasmid) [Alicyclobacillus acidoterrestris]|uniref:ImmA/IrrE family metallo-endopeptidase n=1 Tax=Alicyclobacillus acidoterrestris TaxID=1450 RepID=UPI003F52EAC3
MIDPFIESMLSSNPEGLACRLRFDYMKPGYILNLSRIAEHEGIKVKVANFKNRDIKGLLSKKHMWIVLNGWDSANEQRYALAHELGHYFFHFPGNFICNQDLMYNDGINVFSEHERKKAIVELYANRFAMALLLPFDEVYREWLFASTEEQMAEFFGVPVYVLRRRLQEMRGLGFHV